MDCVHYRTPGEAAVLTEQQWSFPVLSPDSLLVRVHAAGVNRADILQRRGLYPAPQEVSPLLGLELAGIIVEVGKNVEGFAVGEAICGLVQGGAYGRYALVPAACAFRKPSALSFVEAAALPEALSVAQWVFGDDVARLQKGDRCLIHGGSGGIGPLLLQVAQQRGAFVLTTAGHREKCRQCVDFGASVAVNYHDPLMWEQIDEALNGEKIDVVLDAIGGSYVEAHLKRFAHRGRWVLIGLSGGRQWNFDAGLLLHQQISLQACVLRTISYERRAAIVHAVCRDMLPLVEAGALKPILDRVLFFREAAAAHCRVERHEHVGKIVLIWQEEEAYAR